MYTVIGSVASRAFRVIWMLEELEQPYELIQAAPRSPGIRAYNPDGKVPALIVDEATLIDSVAIVQFLADRHSALTYPAGSVERAKQDSFTQFCVDEVEGALWTAAKNTFVHPKEHQTRAVKETCRYEFNLAIERLASRLGSRDFVMGDQITVPDILFGHCAGWARAAKFDLLGGQVGEYFNRLTNRPAFLKANALRSA